MLLPTYHPPPSSPSSVHYPPSSPSSPTIIIIIAIHAAKGSPDRHPLLLHVVTHDLERAAGSQGLQGDWGWGGRGQRLHWSGWQPGPHRSDEGQTWDRRGTDVGWGVGVHVELSPWSNHVIIIIIRRRVIIYHHAPPCRYPPPQNEGDDSCTQETVAEAPTC